VSNGLIILVVLLALAAVWSVSVFNRLVRSRNRLTSAYLQIDVELKRRHDLLPNLVETARGYLPHERQTLHGVTLARQRAIDARQAVAGSGGAGNLDRMEALDRAESGLDTALARFALVVQAYPLLKADHTITQLGEELIAAGNRIGLSRQAFNDAVNAHNGTIGRFPDLLVASCFGFAAVGHLRSTTWISERAPAAPQST